MVGHRHEGELGAPVPAPPKVVTELPDWLVAAVFGFHAEIRRRVRARVAEGRQEELSSVVAAGSGDVSYGIDIPAEEVVADAFASAPEPVVVVAEGPGELVYPAGATRSEALYCVIVDPLDGTRELMYDKRSAFVLTGVAPLGAGGATLADIVFGLMTEVPPSIQSVAVEAWAIRGRGAFERRVDCASGAEITAPIRLEASRAKSIRGGFATIAHYFPGTHQSAGALADRLFRGVLGDFVEGSAEAFDDCYISSGGQLYLMASGRYRLLVDARPELARGREGVRPLCAHPYDLAGGVLVAEEAGAIVTDLEGNPLRYQLDTGTRCSFVAYANGTIRDEVEPVLQNELAQLRPVAQ